MGEEFDAVVTSMNREPPGPSAIMVFVLMGFSLGILAVWLYAAIRPRLGAGAKTAACAGSTLSLPKLGVHGDGLLPYEAYLIGTVWVFFEVTLATVAGAWIYKE